MTTYRVREETADGRQQAGVGPFAAGETFTVTFPRNQNKRYGHQEATGLTTHAPAEGLDGDHGWYPLNESHIAHWLKQGAIEVVKHPDKDEEVSEEYSERATTGDPGVPLIGGTNTDVPPPSHTTGAPVPNRQTEDRTDAAHAPEDVASGDIAETPAQARMRHAREAKAKKEAE